MMRDIETYINSLLFISPKPSTKYIASKGYIILFPIECHIRSPTLNWVFFRGQSHPDMNKP